METAICTARSLKNADRIRQLDWVRNGDLGLLWAYRAIEGWITQLRFPFENDNAYVLEQDTITLTFCSPYSPNIELTIDLFVLSVRITRANDFTNEDFVAEGVITPDTHYRAIHNAEETLTELHPGHRHLKALDHLRPDIPLIDLAEQQWCQRYAAITLNFPSSHGNHSRPATFGFHTPCIVFTFELIDYEFTEK